jgi:hypothetical protein
MPENEKPKRRWARFSLATMVFVSLCIGGLLAGYQSGYRHGYSAGSVQRFDETQAVQTYDTTFLIWPDLPDSERAVGVKELINLIKTTIATDIWDEQLGNDIREFPKNHSLVITAPGSVHRQIRDLLAQFERLQNQGMAEQLFPALQSHAAQGKSRDWYITSKLRKIARWQRSGSKSITRKLFAVFPSIGARLDFRVNVQKASFPNGRSINESPPGSAATDFPILHFATKRTAKLISWRAGASSRKAGATPT